ncbi:sulfotransferase [Tahibacter amnicola]|uniref:Sulfotransferase n=1 Tax=Tahibacter amnicola TaxID=2976241 RepID=A0ABY6BJA4_9GAMM|nr:sulfotransferase [Tahibacter amnicola]UXI70099.1 sulfotransferase [Tahibacter amnicola]
MSGTEAPVRFVVVSARRSGSNMLCTLLDAHPDVLCHHELFNPRGVFAALSCRTAPWCMDELRQRDADPSGFLAQVWRRSAGYRAVGFKMTPGQSPSVLAAMLDDPGIRKIVLRRRNLVRTFVSERIAEAIDQWELYDAAERMPDRPRVRVDVGALLHHVADVQGFYRAVTGQMRATGQRWLEVAYETLAVHDAQSRLFDWLDVPALPEAVTARSVRQNPEPLEQLIANFREVQALLKNHPLSRALRDAD